MRVLAMCTITFFSIKSGRTAHTAFFCHKNMSEILTTLLAQARQDGPEEPREKDLNATFGPRMLPQNLVLAFIKDLAPAFFCHKNKDE